MLRDLRRETSLCVLHCNVSQEAYQTTIKNLGKSKFFFVLFFFKEKKLTQHFPPRPWKYRETPQVFIVSTKKNDRGRVRDFPRKVRLLFFNTRPGSEAALVPMRDIHAEGFR